MDKFRFGKFSEERSGGDIYDSYDKMGFSNNGLYRARVEYNRDPLKQGRIKVRILDKHGVPSREIDASNDRDSNIEVEGGEYDNSYTPHQYLPWAYPCTLFPCGPDFGSFIVPPVGTMVWVMPETNTENYVYLGGVPSVKTEKDREFGRNTDFGESHGNVEKPEFEEDTERHGRETRGMAKLSAAPGEEMAYEVRESFHKTQGNETKEIRDHEIEDEINDYEYEPTVYLMFKSPKGHTGVVEDLIENEYMKFEDRAGQCLKFYAPVRRDTQISKDAKQGLSMEDVQRHDRTADNDNPLDYYTRLGVTSPSPLRVAYINLQDVKGQYMRFWAEHKKQEINIVSQDLTKDEVVQEGKGYSDDSIKNAIDHWKEEDNQNKDKDSKKTKTSRLHLVSGKRREDCGGYLYAEEKDDNESGYVRTSYLYVAPGNEKEQVVDNKSKPKFGLIESSTGAELSSVEKLNKSGETTFLSIKEDIKEKSIFITAKKQGGNDNDGELNFGIEVSLKDKKVKILSGIGGNEKSSTIEMTASGMKISTGQEVKVFAKKDCEIKSEQAANIIAKKDCTVTTEANTKITAKKDCIINTESKTAIEAKGQCSIKTEAQCEIVANNTVNVSANGGATIASQGNTAIQAGGVIHLSASQVIVG